jgi:Asp-tRNA(Asn)/Glu-tRNA(Gln) amidotransferase A subunit family amidase
VKQHGSIAFQKWGFLASAGFAKPFNVIGWPAICVCPGFGEGGLPVSVQIAAKPFEESLLLRVARAFEKATEFRARRPILPPATIGIGLMVTGATALKPPLKSGDG